MFAETLIGRGGADRLYGGAGDDVIYVSGEAFLANGGAGHDMLDLDGLVSTGDLIWQGGVLTIGSVIQSVTGFGGLKVDVTGQHALYWRGSGG